MAYPDIRVKVYHYFEGLRNFCSKRAVNKSVAFAGANLHLLTYVHNLRMQTGGKFAVAGLKIAGASENFVLNY